MNYRNNIVGLQQIDDIMKNELKIKTILKKSQENSNSNTRTDMNGNPISKNSKKYKINFKQNLCQVYVVENWKKYNVLENNRLLLEAEQRKKCLKNCQIF